jgi:hypothetical protein
MLALVGHHVHHVPLADEDEDDPDSLGGIANNWAGLVPPHLAHVQGVGEDEAQAIDIFILKNPAEDLGVPDDAHPEEETQIDAHLVSQLFPAGLLSRGAAAGVMT